MKHIDGVNMNNHIEKQYESLDSSNRLVADQMIQKLMDMQSKAELNFQKIKPIQMVKLPSDYPNMYNVVHTIKEYTNVKNLIAYKNKIIDDIENIKMEINSLHVQNLAAIDSNSELRKKIMEMFSYIGIRNEYTELEYKGMKVKSVTKQAGYLSDLDVFCKVDDGYKSLISTINSNIDEIKREFNKAEMVIKHNDDVADKTKLFYSLNKVALLKNIEISSIFKFIKAKHELLNDVDSKLGDIYQAKIDDIMEDGYDCDSEIYDVEQTIGFQIVQNNFTLIDQDLREILEFDYNSYNYIQKKLVG